MEGGKTYDLGDHAPIQLNITYTLPAQVHIKLDALTRSLVNIDIVESNRNVSKFELDESKISEGAWKCGGQDGFDDLFGHLSGNYGDIGP
jgi:hypothetical protein